MITESRLSRRLNLKDAVFLGLGSMIGAGIFSAASPAALAAGNALLIALLMAAAIAFLNASTMSQLAAIYPESGGAYVYGRKRLGNFWGFLAGWGFVSGKLASCTAMALTFAHYAGVPYPKPFAIGAVLFLTLTNYLGIKKTAFATKVLVALVLLALSIVVFAALVGGAADSNRLFINAETFTLRGTLQAAGLLFFAFAGYARIATLGEEVIDPQKTIPKAMFVALLATLVVYLIVLGTAALTVDIDQLATSPAPLVLAVESGRFGFLSPAVRFGACCASLSVLLSLMAGISRTIFSMASNTDLPTFFRAVHAKHKTPYRAELVVGLIISSVVSFADLRGAIGFSSFAILVYYSIANAASLTLSKEERRWPKTVSIFGLLACLTVALNLPEPSIISGIALFSIGTILYCFRSRRRS